ncbi:MAG TPA: hypothetical protein VJP59_11555 [Gemmatimonadota bacterium]|nr:hypothetical protein [Gemmatimonadota bacterium]
MNHACRGPCALLVLSAVAVFIGCGRDDQPPDLEEIASMGEDEAAEMAREMKDLSGVKACELLTASEIEAATGIAPGAPQDMTQVQGQLPMCTWSGPDGRNVASILVTRGGLTSYDQFVETTRSQLGEDFDESNWQHITDVGDFGVWLPEEAAGGMIQVYDDGMMVQVDAETAEGKDELEASKELAMKVFDRL